VEIALERAPASTCTAAASEDGEITIENLVAAVAHRLNDDCPRS
jgi:hypothetical protein